MVVLVAGERQAETLDRVGDEAVRAIVLDAVERLAHAVEVMAAEIGHQPGERVVVMLGQDVADHVEMAEVAAEALAPGSTTLEGDRGVEVVRTVVDPLAERIAARPREGRLQQLAVFQRHDPPADGAEEILDLLEQPLGHHPVETLAVVVDHPPDVAHIVLPALEQGLEDVALVELGVADDRDHPALALAVRQELALVQKVLRERGEQRHRGAEPDRARREIDAIGVLGARRVGLGAAEGAKTLQLVLGLPPEQVLDGMEHRARMRLDRDPVARPQNVEIERRDQARDGGAGRLMAADLDAVPVRPDVVGVVDRPAGEPQHLALEGGKAATLRVGGGFGRAVGELEHGRIERFRRPRRQRSTGATLAYASANGRQCPRRSQSQARNDA